MHRVEGRCSFGSSLSLRGVDGVRAGGGDFGRCSFGSSLSLRGCFLGGSLVDEEVAALSGAAFH